MGSKLIIESEAQIEIYDAIDWYESRQKGLGEEFLNYIEGYLNFKKWPCNFPNKTKTCIQGITIKTISLCYYF